MTGSALTIDDARRHEAGVIRRALDFLYLAAGYAAGAFLVAIFVLMMLLSIGREINLNVPSGDDFTSWSLVAMAFLGLAHTFKRGEMIRVGLLLERLQGRPKRIAELLSLTIAAAFIGYFTWQAGQLAYDSWRFFDMSTGVVSIPLWIPQLGLVAGLAILLIAILDEWLIVASGRRPTYEKEPAATPEELIERVASGGGV
ncbi:TRAP-type C4-dicarboxylate transport system, small permease component [Bosea sp. OK403]|uniref:TRAP transporter small permease n=1 Tax=Bosea sp. OK403 TaxID=1855286 RepID=UPI0008E66BFD|nr:TRAP transporter small permease [Bosea sp. OK403]SFI34415.1 TRAP-type C4-dicarboxylate transport system, small permease component [Bosea sp. OK403]